MRNVAPRGRSGCPAGVVGIGGQRLDRLGPRVRRQSSQRVV